MTVPPTAYPVLQMSAIMRAENLRRLEIPQIDAALNEYADTFSNCNAGLTGRERICRLANQLASFKGLVREASVEIGSIVTQLRRAFKLEDLMAQSTTHGAITELVRELDQKYPVYCISDKLRLDDRFINVHGVADIKNETARVVSALLVIGMNADGEVFLIDLEQTIQKMTRIMLAWM